MSKIIVHRRAMRYLQRLPRPVRERVKTALLHLADAPSAYPGAIAMAGEWAGYRRIRIGELRVIYWHDEQSDTVYVDHVGPRGDIYKQ